MTCKALNGMPNYTYHTSGITTVSLLCCTGITGAYDLQSFEWNAQLHIQYCWNYHSVTVMLYRYNRSL